jgi:hypothetical protein
MTGKGIAPPPVQAQTYTILYRFTDGGGSVDLIREPELVAMHAGLECGVIGEKHPGMQMISFGPHIVDVHSPSERLKIFFGRAVLSFADGAAGAALRHNCRRTALACPKT